MRFRYRERMHISALEAENEPAEEIEKAFMIWEFDAVSAKLEAERQNQSNG